MSDPEDHLSTMLSALAIQLSTGHARVVNLELRHDAAGSGQADIRFSYKHPLVHEPETDKAFRERIAFADKGHLTPLEYGLAMIVTGVALDKIGQKIGLVRTPAAPIVRPTEAR